MKNSENFSPGLWIIFTVSCANRIQCFQLLWYFFWFSAQELDIPLKWIFSHIVIYHNTMYRRPFLNHRIPTSVVVVMLTLTLVIRGLLNVWRGCVIPSVNGTDCCVIRFFTSTDFGVINSLNRRRSSCIGWYCKT